MKTTNCKMLCIGLLACLLAACSVEDGDDISTEYFDANQVAMTFEGVWNIDGTPAEQPSLLTYANQGDQQTVTLQAFPYDVALSTLTPDLQDYQVVEPATAPTFTLSPIGYSASANYTEMLTSKGEDYGHIQFGAISTDGDEVSVVLDLLPSKSTFVVSETTANCILMVKRLHLTRADGQQRTWALNPERRLTFTSTRRTR
ncbi:MAG: hypothetical protein IJ544_00630 [Prevotella sp.]|nr:hypothetical protein [Prevotella sp.]